jgi:hypothetical protein
MTTVTAEITPILTANMAVIKLTLRFGHNL